MNLLAPLAAWFALTIPVIVLFYLLKRRRVVLRVPSTVLWQRYLAETQASAPFQKLRKNWLLLLQILLLIFAVFALMRPYLGSQSAPSSLRVLILDASASMQSTDEEPSRFEAAKHEARRWIDGLRPGQMMVLLQAGPRTDVRQSATSDKPLLREALAGCQVTDGAARMGEALRMAESLIRDVADAEIHLFSDGSVGSLAEFENHNLPLIYHRVGQRRNNVALTSLEVRPNPENPQQRAVFVGVANLSPAAVETTVELEFDRDMVDTRPVTIPPGESASLVFVVSQNRDGIFRARHTAPDDLSADNQATVMSLLPPPVKVLLVTRGNRFLERALRLAGHCEVTVGSDNTQVDGKWDVVVLDDVVPTAWPSANVIAVRVAETNWFERTGTLRAPAIVDWRSTHPLLRFVSLDNVAIAEAVGVKPPPWGNVLIEAPQGPLLVAGEIGRHRVVWIGFDLLGGTWPLRVSFPIFIANAVDWLNPTLVRAERLNIRAGDPLRYELPEAASTVEVKPPGGDWERVTLDAGAREAVYGATDRQGAYELRWGTNQVTFAVRALDLAESDSTPRAEIPVGRFGGTAATSVKQVNLEIWRWLAGAALAILMVEWWYFHRRTA
ncbi:MAG: BatA and WFA domain-containing protein [Verrucomicrobiales bacterium]|nr:BatA and WFA domain-containing protein [Verrucomicrobiales bacterium]